MASRSQTPTLHQLNHPVFFVPLVVLLTAVALSLWRGDQFIAVETAVNQWILGNFGFLFAFAGLAFLALLVAVAIAPVGRVIIGGPDAIPLLGRWNWFAVTLCTTIATGILFWGVAEPLFHLNDPPAMLGLEPGSDAAARFAMSTMFLHWTLTPYAIYTVGALAFALLYYNHREAFSLSSLFVPLLGARAHGKIGTAIDITCLFSLVAGMAASLGAGMLALAGGIEGLAGFSGGPMLRWAIAAAIVTTFVASAALGLKRGIARLSIANFWLFLAILMFVLATGPMRGLPSLAALGASDYVTNFLPRSLGMDVDLAWHEQWTIFNWANWFAWAPVTALFLGRLTVGYSVRAAIAFNLLLPALFSSLWMITIAGSTIGLDRASGASFYALLVAQGPDPLLYRLFADLGGGALILTALIIAIFLSYVTAADSNISAMSALSTHGISPATPEAPLAVKIIWGATVGLVAVVLVAASGIDGIRMMSVLGGFPALFVITGAAVSLAIIAFRTTNRVAATPG